MRSILKSQVFIVLLFYSLISCAQEIKVSSTTTDSARSEMIYEIVDEFPIFPGGYEWYLARNTNYPPNALEEGIQGTVYAKIIIEKDGSISDVEIIKGDSILATEVIRVLYQMPPWQPGKLDGKPVRCKIIVPVKFKINDSGQTLPEKPNNQIGKRILASVGTLALVVAFIVIF